jgi:Uma2 family endonuclease
MRGTTIKPLTVEEFAQLDLPPDRLWELHNGEVVEMTFPVFIHRLLQDRLVELLKPLFQSMAVVLMEYPFRIGNHDVRAADVGMALRDRVALVGGIPDGPPEMVIEVLSPSNAVSALKAYRRLCQKHGTLVFWVVDPDDNTVEAYIGRSDRPILYGMDEEIPIELFGVAHSLRLSGIFNGITIK